MNWLEIKSLANSPLMEKYLGERWKPCVHFWNNLKRTESWVTDFWRTGSVQWWSWFMTAAPLRLSVAALHWRPILGVRNQATQSSMASCWQSWGCSLSLKWLWVSIILDWGSQVSLAWRQRRLEFSYLRTKLQKGDRACSVSHTWSSGKNLRKTDFFPLSEREHFND